MGSRSRSVTAETPEFRPMHLSRERRGSAPGARHGNDDADQNWLASRGPERKAMDDRLPPRGCQTPGGV